MGLVFEYRQVNNGLRYQNLRLRDQYLNRLKRVICPDCQEAQKTDGIANTELPDILPARYPSGFLSFEARQVDATIMDNGDYSIFSPVLYIVKVLAIVQEYKS